MFKKTILLLSGIVLLSCENETPANPSSTPFPSITKVEAAQLLELPLHCITQEYPNKLGQVLGSETDLATPKSLRPAFYGCFDWHSAVHGHWSLVVLLKNFPDLPHAEEVKQLLKNQLSKEHIQKEIEFFNTQENASFERTYGWAWLFQLANELKTWEDEGAEELLQNITPLVEVLESKMIAFLPKLVYPIRVGEHTNTAFALSLTYDYAVAFQKIELQALIKQSALRFYAQDAGCPLRWEPSGYDFLSPCLEEAKLMAKLMEKDAFQTWLTSFLPELYRPNFQLSVAQVSDRTDGKLVHLDGLNFSRAWNFFELSSQPGLAHLEEIGNQHFVAAYPNLVGDSYEGAHWLGSFALYAFQKKAD